MRRTEKRRLPLFSAPPLSSCTFIDAVLLATHGARRLQQKRPSEGGVWEGRDRQCPSATRLAPAGPLRPPRRRSRAAPKVEAPLAKRRSRPMGRHPRALLVARPLLGRLSWALILARHPREPPLRAPRAPPLGAVPGARLLFSQASSKATRTAWSGPTHRCSRQRRPAQRRHLGRRSRPSRVSPACPPPFRLLQHAPSVPRPATSAIACFSRTINHGRGVSKGSRPRLRLADRETPPLLGHKVPLHLSSKGPLRDDRRSGGFRKNRSLENGMSPKSKS